MTVTEAALLISIAVNLITAMTPVFTKMVENKHNRKVIIYQERYKERSIIYKDVLRYAQLIRNPNTSITFVDSFMESASHAYLLCSDESRDILDELFDYLNSSEKRTIMSKFDMNLSVLRESFQKELNNIPKL